MMHGTGGTQGDYSPSGLLNSGGSPLESEIRTKVPHLVGRHGLRKARSSSGASGDALLRPGDASWALMPSRQTERLESGIGS